MSLRSEVMSSLRGSSISPPDRRMTRKKRSSLSQNSPMTMQRRCEELSFVWVIGYERDPGELGECVSQIVFRYPPSLTECDLRQAREWAREALRALGLLRGRP